MWLNKGGPVMPLQVSVNVMEVLSELILPRNSALP
jgi:hypothetical protein